MTTTTGRNPTCASLRGDVASLDISVWIGRPSEPSGPGTHVLGLWTESDEIRIQVDRLSAYAASRVDQL